MSRINKKAKQIDIEILKGSTLRWYNRVAEGALPFDYTQADLDALVDIDLTNKLVKLIISPKGCVAENQPFDPIELTTDNGDIVVDSEKVGLLHLAITSTQSEQFTWTQATYKIVVELGEDDNLIVSFGRIKIYDIDEEL